MPSDSDPNETAVRSLEAGVALALKAQDSGDWKPVVDWIARNPGHAAELRAFLDAHEGLKAIRPVQVHQAGTSIGGFILKEEIGRGAMGVVYAASDPVLKREVAMKLIRPGLVVTDVNLTRFRVEAETVAGFDHPHIVRVHAFGETDGLPYLVMPLMEGGSLAQKLKALGPNRLPLNEAAELIRDLALGVHHAHQRGLIHRDLKPGNVLLDADGRPHVADFGLARSVDVTATLSGGIVGTPAYMAPEQMRTEMGLTVAVDIHALGAILFELLTGRPPFGNEDIPLILKRVEEEPAPSIRGFRADVPADLEAICRMCLEKEPSDRYRSAEELADDLTGFLNGDPRKEHIRGRVWGSVSRALGRRRETLEMGRWHVLYWGGASTAVTIACLQAAVLLDAPLWVLQASIGAYLLGWVVIMWCFLVARRDVMNPVERASTAMHFGAEFACIAILPVQMSLHDGNPVYALPSFLVIVGLAVFAHGIFYWGRLYLLGMFFFAVAALMPLVSPTWWPAIYGVHFTAHQFLVGMHLRRVHKSTQAARQKAI